MSSPTGEEKSGGINFPTQRLAAITRRRNEVSQALQTDPSLTKDEVKFLLQEYIQKIRNFEEECSPILNNEDSQEVEQFRQWYSTHHKEATSFIKVIEDWLRKKEHSTTVNACDSISQVRSGIGNRTVSSRSSSRSQSSSLKAELARKRAQRKADEGVLKERRLLEESQRKREASRLEKEALRLQEEAKEEALRLQEESKKVFEESLRLQEESKKKAEEAQKKALRLQEEAQKKALRLKEEAQENYEKAKFQQQMQDLDRHRTILLEENLEREIENVEQANPSSNFNKTRKHDVSGAASILKEISQAAPIQNPYFDNCKQFVEQKKFTLPQEEAIEKKSCLEERNNQLADVLNKQNEISLLILETQNKANLPKHEPEVFDGLDLTRYTSFIQSFEGIIEDRCRNNLDRIFYLEKYTSGLPQQIVKGCRTKDSSAGYANARHSLEREFGNDYKISNAYIQKIEKWDPIKNEDGRKLQELSIFLFSCYNQMQNESFLNQLNSPSEIMKIVYKLPYKMRDGWRRYAHRLGTSKFKDFCEFVRRESDLVNQPLFGDIADRKEEKRTSKTMTSTHKKVFATDVHIPKSEVKLTECRVCKKTNHRMQNCFFFKKKSNEEKIQYLKNNKLCFACFGINHTSSSCKMKAKCNDCGLAHPTAMHRNENSSKDRKRTSSAPSSETKKEDVSQTKTENDISVMTTKTLNVSHQSGAGPRIISPAIPVKVRAVGSNETVLTYMGIDSYCSDVFMSMKLLSKLGLKGRKANISLTTMHHSRQATETQVVNNLEIFDLDENVRTLVSSVFCPENWPFNKEDSPTKLDVDQSLFLNEVPFRFIDEEIGLLVGMSQPQILKVLKTIDGPDENGPFATLHRFGWALNGPLSSQSNKTYSCHRMKVNHSPNIDNQFKELCARDFADDNGGILSPSIEDQRWEEIVKSSINKRSDGHFEVELPFRDSLFNFPSNREQVLNRLKSSKRKLVNNLDFFNEYRSFMDLMLQNKFAERVPDHELQTDPGKSWYLFHFGIYHKQKKKIRIVFDASLKYQGVSLNDTLLQGPDLTSSLLGVLLRFRQEPIGTMADIRKMFYMVGVPVHQRDFLRYFWYPDGDLHNQPVEYRVTVHIFGAVSSPSIANYVLRYTATTAECHQYSEEAKCSISRNFYVDDLVKSVNTEEKAIDLLKEIRTLIASGGFDLVGFVSNSRSVLESIPMEDLATTFKDLDIFSDDLPYERALGVTWNVERDTLGFRLNLPVKENTRRGVLSTVFSLYDPLGIACPAILPAKRIFQKSCSRNLEWDDSLPPDLLKDWRTWLQDISLLSNFQIQRCIKIDPTTSSIQLHIFCDGSETAYAAAAYLRSTSEKKQVNCSLIMAKTRLVPLKGTTAMSTIPRIELNGAKLAVLVYQTLKNELELHIDNTFFWTDSSTVLKYLNSETGRFQRFVANRVAFIRNHSNIKNWRHIPGKLNPADIASRGSSVSELLNDDQWKFGPQFLELSEEEWLCSQQREFLNDGDPELKKGRIVVSTKIEIEQPTEKLLSSSSSWFQTKIKVSYFLRLKQGLKSGVWKETPLTVKDLHDAATAIFRYIQFEKFSSTIQQLRSKQSLLRNDCLLKLCPFLDDEGLMRVGGRISRAVASHDIKHPIILPKSHHSVQLLVKEIHKEVGHLGIETMLSQIRKTYWILGVNSLARRVVKECFSCRKRHGKPSTQLMADLPENRLASDLPPFTNIGIDCFGPFMVTRGRGKEKRYGVIFTCLASRAIHLEIIFTLETDSFISALRRFASRRGYPTTIRSDNGTNFVGAKNELEVSVNDRNNAHLNKFLLQQNITWKFHPPAASHFGGIWEREIRTIRKVLSGLTNEQPLHLNDEGLATLMCEVESILNSRPLTAISNDPNDLEALTPNHLLLSHSEVTFPPGLFTKEDLYVKRRWRQIQYLAELFWTRWRREYIPLLQKRQKWTDRKPSHEVGDLVLVVDQLLPRNQWSLGRVVRIIKDSRGDVRVVDVRVAKIKGELKPGFQTIILQRPIAKLILLKSICEL